MDTNSFALRLTAKRLCNSKGQFILKDTINKETFLGFSSSRDSMSKFTDLPPEDLATITKTEPTEVKLETQGNSGSGEAEGSGGQDQSNENTSRTDKGKAPERNPETPSGGVGGGEEPDEPEGSDPDDDDSSSDSSDDSISTNRVLTLAPDVMIAKTLALLARRSSAPSNSVRVRNPTPFDGSNPSKLRVFLMQGELVFTGKPRAYSKDKKKVLYMLSHLSGTTLAWFELSIVDPIPGFTP